MKQIKIICDICGREIPDNRGWENDPRSCRIETRTAGGNPLGDLGLNKGKNNSCEAVIDLDEVCRGCQEALSDGIYQLIKKLQNK